MKTTLLLLAIAGAFVVGVKCEAALEWRTCRALSFFEKKSVPSPALAIYHVTRPPEPERRRP